MNERSNEPSEDASRNADRYDGHQHRGDDAIDRGSDRFPMGDLADDGVVEIEGEVITVEGASDVASDEASDVASEVAANRHQLGTDEPMAAHGVREPDSHPPADRPAAENDASLNAGHQDTVLLTTLSPAMLAVQPGTSAEMQVRLLNNGDRTALFEVLFEGWIDPTWLNINPLYKTLQPGERATVNVVISPSRQPAAQAGHRQIVVVVRSPDYPGRESRQFSQLELLPYDDVQVGVVTPRTVEASWGERVCQFEVPVTNNGNHVIQARVQGQADAGEFHFVPVDIPQIELGPFVAQDLLVTLDPGETALLRGSIRPYRLPLLGLQPQVRTFRILVNLVGKPQVPRVAVAQMRCRPLMGPRRMALAVLLFTFLLVIFTILGATGFGLAQIVSSLTPTSLNQNRPPAALVAPTPPPIIAVVVPVDLPVPTSSGVTVGAAAPIVVSVGDGTDAAVPSDRADVAGAGRDPSVPLVAVGEVSAPVVLVQPDSVAPPTVSPPTGSSSTGSSSAGLVSPQSPDRSTLTYAQMFQEIALRYDLDWRMLAAQAYVESRFDTLALGSDGDLGLMQVLPRTWKEWAPAVDVNDPFDAYSNVLVAGAYLDYLRSYLGQSEVYEIRWMLVAYNWGPDKLNSFLAEGNGWDDLPDGLKKYAGDVLRIAESIPEN